MNTRQLGQLARRFGPAIVGQCFFCGLDCLLHCGRGDADSLPAGRYTTRHRGRTCSPAAWRGTRWSNRHSEVSPGLTELGYIRIMLICVFK